MVNAGREKLKNRSWNRENRNQENWKARDWKIKLFLSVAVLAAFAGGCGRNAAENSDVTQRIVCVKSGALTGSGVIYKKTDDMLVIVTAAHVLEQGQSGQNKQGQAKPEAWAEIIFFDGFTVPGDPCYMSYSSDLAFINVPLSELTDSQRKDYTPVNVDKKAFDALQSGSQVCFSGTNQINAESSSEENALTEATESGAEGAVLESWIYVEDFGQYMMLLQGAIYPGMSGGGVFDAENKFLGILCGANEKGEVAAVPLSIIEAEYAGAY